VRSIALALGQRRQAQGRRLDRIVIDDEIECRRAVGASQAAQREVLRPDTGVKQLRLMPGDEDRLHIGILEFGFRIFAEVVEGGFDGAFAGLTPRLGPRNAEQRAPVGMGAQPPAIGGEDNARFAQGRLGDDGAIAGRRTRDAPLAQ